MEIFWDTVVGIRRSLGGLLATAPLGLLVGLLVLGGGGGGTALLGSNWLRGQGNPSDAIVGVRHVVGQGLGWD